MFLSFSNVLLEGECHSIETIVTLVFCSESFEVAYFPYLFLWFLNKAVIVG